MSDTAASRPSCVDGRGHRPALHPLHLRHDREAEGHRPRQRRPRGRAALVDAEHLRRRPGRDRGSPRRDVGWVVGHSYIVYAPLLVGAHDRPLRGQAGRHPRRRARSGGSSTSTASRRCSPRPPRSGRSRRRTRTASTSASTTCQLAQAPLPRRRAARPGHLPLGARRCSASRSSTTGGRPRRAGRSRPTRSASSSCRSSRARRRVPCPATTCRCSTTVGEPVPAGTEGAIAIKLPMPPGHAADAVAATTSATCSRYLSAYDGYYLTGDGGLHRRGRLRLRHGPHRRRDQRGRAPPVHRRRSRRRWPATRTSPSARSSASHDELKGQVPRGLVVLKAGVDARPRTSRSAAELVAAGARRGRRGGARCSEVDVVAALPKTRSGKILRKTMRADRRRPGRPGPVARSRTRACSTSCARCSRSTDQRGQHRGRTAYQRVRGPAPIRARRWWRRTGRLAWLSRVSTAGPGPDGEVGHMPKRTWTDVPAGRLL